MTRLHERMEKMKGVSENEKKLLIKIGFHTHGETEVQKLLAVL